MNELVPVWWTGIYCNAKIKRFNVNNRKFQFHFYFDSKNRDAYITFSSRKHPQRRICLWYQLSPFMHSVPWCCFSIAHYLNMIVFAMPIQPIKAYTKMTTIFFFKMPVSQNKDTHSSHTFMRIHTDMYMHLADE